MEPLGIVAAVVAVVQVTASRVPQPDRWPLLVPGQTGGIHATDDLLFISWGLLVATGFGFWLIWQGFKLRRQRELIQETPTAEIESVSIGPTELTGTAEPLGETITAPFSEDECLVASWEVEEWRESDDKSYWKTVDEGVDFTPFVLDDGTGKVRVDPRDSAEFVIKRGQDDVRRVNVDSTPPPRVQEFLDRNDTIGDSRNLLTAVDPGNQEGDRRYRQNLLQSGDSAYVYGAVRTDDEPGDTSLIIGPATKRVNTGMFMISDVSEARLLERREWALFWRLPVGALLAACGIGGLWVLFTWV